MKQYNTTQIIEDYKNLKSTYKVAPLHNITANTVRNVLLKEGIHLPSINDKHKHLISVALEEYKNGSSMKQIELKYGITNSYFKKILKENGLEYINRAKNPSSGPVVYIKENLEELIFDYNINKNLTEVAIKHNIKFEPLYRYFKTQNLLSREHKRVDKEKSQLLKDEVYKMYKEGLDLTAIGKKLNTSRYNIKKIILDHFGKESMRSKGEAIRLMNLTEEHQQKAHTGLGKKT
jgi:DNA invertase Pin-like site-specific DNA recombinase